MKFTIYFIIFFCLIPSVYSKTKAYSTQKVSSLVLDQLKKELKNRPNPLMSSLVNKRFRRIYSAISKKKSDEKLLQLISQLEQLVKNRPYPLSRVYLLKAQVYFGKDDFEKSLLFYKKSLDMKQLSYSDHLSVLFDMATIYLFQHKIKKARNLVDQWFYLADTIAPAGYVLKAAILVEQNKKKEALNLVLRAIRGTSTPKESWLTFAISLHIELRDYVSATQLLKKLTALYPAKQKYWKQLSAVYVNQNKDTIALSMMDLAHKLKKLDKKQDILHLASLLMYEGQPLKAGVFLEQAMELGKIKKNQKHYEMLGDCWIRAEETAKAIKAYHLSTKNAKNGIIFAKLASIYLDMEKWDKVIDYFQLALAKGPIKRPEQVYISMGIAYFNLKQYNKSIKSFEQVIMTEAKGRWIKIAREWINYVSRQIPQYISDSQSIPL